MLSIKGVISRYFICFACFFLSGTGLVTGWPATICGVFGTIELATALIRYSPLCELKIYSDMKSPKVVKADKLRYPNYHDTQVQLAAPLKKSV